jgi:hypothetical protein
MLTATDQKYLNDIIDLIHHFVSGARKKENQPLIVGILIFLLHGLGYEKQIIFSALQENLRLDDIEAFEIIYGAIVENSEFVHYCSSRMLMSFALMDVLNINSKGKNLPEGFLDLFSVEKTN